VMSILIWRAKRRWETPNSSSAALNSVWSTLTPHFNGEMLGDLPLSVQPFHGRIAFFH
jgi:hypothetical protein